MKSFLEYRLLLGLATIVRMLSLPTARKVARFLGRFFFHVLPIRKGLALRQLRLAFPEKSEAEIRRIACGSYVNLCTVLVELLWIPNLTDEQIHRLVRLKNPALIDATLKKGRGLIFLSGHVGNWELLAFGGARVVGTPFVIVVHPQQNERVAAMINRIRCLGNNRVVDMKMGVREIIQTLRSRGVVALLTDQSGPRDSIYVPFFGRTAATYEGPAALALKLRVPVIMAFSIRREDGGYDVPLIDIPMDDLQEPSQENIEELTRRHVRILEDYVRRYPDQWLWQHRRWKHTPRTSTEQQGTSGG